MKSIHVVFVCVVGFFIQIGAFSVYYEPDDAIYDIRSNEIDEDPMKFRQVNLIFPGTKWCGSGNVSEDNWSLGKYKKTDACCRDHDYCDDLLEPGQTKNNLTNDSFHTKLNCKCDHIFYKCLKDVGEKTSKTVGTIYFNALGTECYKEDYPIVKCVKYHKFLRKRCETYILDMEKPLQWQWFDVPVY